MKESVYCLIPACLLLFSCVKIAPDVSLQTTTPRDITQEVTSNNVSMKDVINIVGKDLPTTKAVGEKFTITPYIGSASDTLMYIVNNKDENGWTIYSSDKRTPAILAKGDTGSFSLENGSPALAVWMSHVANDIARVRRSTDAELSFSEDEILANKAFWGEEQPRGLDDPIIQVGYPLGHWEEVIYSTTVQVDYVEHLVAHWDQSAPYNELCPYYVSLPNERAAAGCVAIAGSQVLFYLHNTLGIPSEMYDDGFCNGNIYNFQRGFTTQSSTTWSQMNMDYQGYSYSTLPEAIMIGHVGMRVNMHYCDDIFGQYSWALPGNLKTDLFEFYGISCSQGGYDEDVVKNSLLNQMPVIVTASDLMIPANFRIHTFVIDGYLRTRTQYTHHYYYVLDETPVGPYLMPEEYSTYTYSSPEITGIKINWGWWSQWSYPPKNNGWYALTGGWTVEKDDLRYDYNYNLSMIYGFAVAE